MSNNSSNTTNLVKGTLILTVAAYFSKILGFVYVVPFTALVGTQGYILYEYAYKPYVIILSIATIGLPAAVSKMVSKYNSIGDYKTGIKIYKSGLILLTATGLIAFAILFLLAPTIASYIIDPNDSSGNTLEDVTFVIQMVSFALIIVPPMAISRGFFQGYQQFTPTAVSQVIEQLFRIIFILISAFVTINLLNKSIGLAVGLATFAAMVGAVAGSFVLYYYWKKEKNNMKTLQEEQSVDSNTKLPSLYKELFKYAVPLVITGLSISLYQLIDTFTINKAIMNTGATQLEAETVNSITSLVQKIILIPTSLATAMSLSLLPTITSAFTSKDNLSLQSLINKTFIIVTFLTLPCITLLMALAEPTFGLLFPSADNSIGTQLMFFYAPTAFFISIYLVTTPILQGMELQKIAIVSLFAGLIIKLSTNIYLVEVFGGIGSAISTNVALLISILINIYFINKNTSFFKKFDSKSIVISVILSIIVLVIAFLIDLLVNSLLSNSIGNSYLLHGTRLILAGGLAGLFLLLSSHKLGLLEDVIGSRMVSKLKKIPLLNKLIK